MHLSTKVLGAVCATVIALGVSGCGQTEETTETTVTTSAAGETTTSVAASATASVPIRSFVYVPPTLTVKPGTRVTWTNEDSAMHTVTSGANRTPDGKFDARLEQGETFSFTFDSPGTYEYYCKPHTNMVAKVVVAQ